MSSEGDMRLDAIVDYNMDELEAKAYKIVLLWLDKSRTMFPDYAHAKIKKSGDPRKSQIFKYGYKLVRETIGILEESDYALYVRSQLEILKNITRGKIHSLIDPNCLVGEKAWIRWKFWKRKYDERNKVIENKVPVPVSQIKMEYALNKTKEFLVKTFGNEVSIEKFRTAVQDKSFHRWLTLEKISPYYLVLSPLVAALFPEGVDKVVKMDLEIYRQVITPEITEYFDKMFGEKRRKRSIKNKVRPGR